MRRSILMAAVLAACPVFMAASAEAAVTSWRITADVTIGSATQAFDGTFSVGDTPIFSSATNAYFAYTAMAVSLNGVDITASLDPGDPGSYVQGDWAGPMTAGGTLNQLSGDYFSIVLPGVFSDKNVVAAFYGTVGSGVPASFYHVGSTANPISNLVVSQVADVPEPASALLLGAGLLGVAVRRRRG